MTVNDLIKELVYIRVKYGNVNIAKSFMLKDSYETSRRQWIFREIEPKIGTMKEILTVPHDIFVQRITGERIMTTMQVDEESKELFTYSTNNILSL